MSDYNMFQNKTRNSQCSVLVQGISLALCVIELEQLKTTTNVPVLYNGLLKRVPVIVCTGSLPKLLKSITPRLLKRAPNEQMVWETRVTQRTRNGY
jgi:hypothetical protein